MVGSWRRQLERILPGLEDEQKVERVTQGSGEREVLRKRLQALCAYHSLRGHGAIVQALRKQEKALPIGGVMPEYTGTLIAHCGTWWPLEALPWVAPCCGWTLSTIISSVTDRERNT